MTQVHISAEIDSAVVALDASVVDTDESRASFLDFVREDTIKRLTEGTDVFRPFHVQITSIEASFCSTHEEIDAFHTGASHGHECERCAMTKPAAHASLGDFPGGVVVLMNIHLDKFYLNPLTP